MRRVARKILEARTRRRFWCGFPRDFSASSILYCLFHFFGSSLGGVLSWIRSWEALSYQNLFFLISWTANILLKWPLHFLKSSERLSLVWLRDLIVMCARLFTGLSENILRRLVTLKVLTSDLNASIRLWLVRDRDTWKRIFNRIGNFRTLKSLFHHVVEDITAILLSFCLLTKVVISFGFSWA